MADAECGRGRSEWRCLSGMWWPRTACSIASYRMPQRRQAAFRLLLNCWNIRAERGDQCADRRYGWRRQERHRLIPWQEIPARVWFTSTTARGISRALRSGVRRIPRFVRRRLRTSTAMGIWILRRVPSGLAASFISGEWQRRLWRRCAISRSRKRCSLFD